MLAVRCSSSSPSVIARRTAPKQSSKCTRGTELPGGRCGFPGTDSRGAQSGSPRQPEDGPPRDDVHNALPWASATGNSLRRLFLPTLGNPCQGGFQGLENRAGLRPLALAGTRSAAYTGRIGAVIDAGEVQAEARAAGHTKARAGVRGPVGPRTARLASSEGTDPPTRPRGPRAPRRPLRPAECHGKRGYMICPVLHAPKVIETYPERPAGSVA